MEIYIFGSLGRPSRPRHSGSTRSRRFSPFPNAADEDGIPTSCISGTVWLAFPTSPISEPLGIHFPTSPKWGFSPKTAASRSSLGSLFCREVGGQPVLPVHLDQNAVGERAAPLGIQPMVLQSRHDLTGGRGPFMLVGPVADTFLGGGEDLLVSYRPRAEGKEKCPRFNRLVGVLAIEKTVATN